MTVNAQTMLELRGLRWIVEHGTNDDLVKVRADILAALPPSQEVPAAPAQAARAFIQMAFAQLKEHELRQVVEAISKNLTAAPPQAQEILELADEIERCLPKEAVLLPPYVERVVKALRLAAPAVAQPQADGVREAIARKIAEWMGYSFDDLHAHSVVERGFREWLPDGYHGGKPDLLRFADALIMAHTRPESNPTENIEGGA